MKSTNYIKVLISLVGSLTILSGCKSAAPIADSEQEKKSVQVSLSFDIEGGLEIEDPYSTTGNKSTASTDIIAVQIYSVDDQGAKSAVAYGLFDSYSSIEDVELIEGTKYIAEVSTMIDGQTFVAERTDGGGFYSPFLLSSYSMNSTTVLNYFTYSSLYFTGLAKGDTEISASSTRRDTYTHPFAERYYGCTEVFAASEQNSSISLDIKRVYSVLRLKCENLANGTVQLKINGSPVLEFSSEDNDVERDINISLAGTEIGDSSWSEDDYSEVITYDLIHYSSSGAESTLTSGGQMTLYRNKIHPATIKVNIQNGLNVSVEQGEMEVLGEVNL